ncbi:hypothetical protein C6P45_004941 [Maudiozyma exigua]|uniref:Uncharacterized protein n=1 Tax=Maudiozyma exigua TaxID=34358 RepID=A0A9P7B9K2_MAUEX|nr:hypothetical protein C6P45_004941 [Kazachstania exigua]
MYDWGANIFNISNEKRDDDKYGLQMSLTLSTHPLLEQYREEIRAMNQEEPYDNDSSWYLMFKCDIPKGRHDFPTIIVKDQSFFGQSIYIKDAKYKEVDPSLFKPFEFGPNTPVYTIGNQVLYWNVPLIFVGFEDVNRDGIYSLFMDIIKSSPFEENISSIEFLEYMSQPVVFWVKSASDEEDNEKDEGDSQKDEPHFDKLEYKKMSNIITNDLFKLMRNSYLESIGRKLLENDEFGNENYLETKQLKS